MYRSDPCRNLTIGYSRGRQALGWSKQEGRRPQEGLEADAVRENRGISVGHGFRGLYGLNVYCWRSLGNLRRVIASLGRRCCHLLDGHRKRLFRDLSGRTCTHAACLLLLRQNPDYRTPRSQQDFRFDPVLADMI